MDVLSSFTSIVSPKAVPGAPLPAAAESPFEGLASHGDGTAATNIRRASTPRGDFAPLAHRGDGTHQILRRPSTPKGTAQSLMFNTTHSAPGGTDVVSAIIPSSPTIGRDLSSTKATLDAKFSVSTPKMVEIVQAMLAEIELGLKEDGHTLKCLPSFVTELPNGKERGTFIALDMGGTNFRICEIGLNRDPLKPIAVRQQSYSLSNALKNGTGEELFDFMASAVSTFLNQTGVHVGGPSMYEIGFTFSYPSLQVGIANGILLQWTKGLNCSGVVGHDAGKMMQDALDRKRVSNARVAALVNDTVGTLVGHAFVNPNTSVGVICGTGNNGCYVENIDNIPKWKGPRPKSGKMIVNIEWGAFDNEKRVLPLTEYDETLDRASINPGKQIFEKTIGGMYLGEIARLIAVDLASNGEIFVASDAAEGDTAQCPDSFLEQWRLDTGHLAQFEVDSTPGLQEIADILRKEFHVADKVNTLETREILKHIAYLVSNRAAKFVAAAVSAVLIKQGFREKLVDGRATVAIDGSVFERYPDFKARMAEGFRSVLGGFGDRVDCELGKDGSGVGAGVIAALVSRGM